MASTGSRRAAESAGINPAINPITLEIINPVIILPFASEIFIDAA